LDRVKAFPIPFVVAMCIVKEDETCVVPIVRQQAKSEPKVFLAMQLSTGLNKREPTYLAALSMDDATHFVEKLLEEVIEVLEYYKDVKVD